MSGNTEERSNDEKSAVFHYDGCSDVPVDVKHVLVQEGITSIPKNAFEDRKMLMDIKLPTTISSIGALAFWNCRKLMKVNLPDGLTSILRDAFADCTSLEKVELPDTITSIDDGAFCNCSKLMKVNLPDGLTSIPSGAFRGCTSLEKVELPDTITSIDNYAFEGCYHLQDINIPEGVIDIGNGAFGVCYSLEEINLPISVTNIGGRAFMDCHNMKSMAIPPDVTTINDRTFKNCYSLEELILPPNIKSIGEKAFDNCCKLLKLDIPTSIESIDKNNFYGCFKIELDEASIASSVMKEFQTHFVKNINESPWSIEWKNKLRKIDGFQEGPGATHGFKGKTQRGWGPEKCALTKHQLELILKHPMCHRKDGNNKYIFSMREFVALEITAVTFGLGVSLGLLFNQVTPLQAMIMVSHAWGESVFEFITALLQSGHDGPFWICAFSIYQNDDEMMGPTIMQQLSNDVTYGPFATVLRCVTKMVAVPTYGCNIYERLWCVFEMYYARVLGVEVILCPYGETRFNFDKIGEYFGDMDRNMCIANIEDKVDSNLARCGNPNSEMNEDERMIRRLIDASSDKFAGVNEAVEYIRFLFLINYPTERIEKNKTKGRDCLKHAIEMSLPRVRNNEKRMKYDEYLQDQLTSHSGFKEVNQGWNKNIDYYGDKGDHDYYIVNSDDEAEKIDTFHGWSLFLRNTKE